ncbi:L-aminoadipate-semialdehyde dehydrogenase-phosphopantetheinyl transferase [Euphorbia peplus]|nr:L-aminoadipate-semialdehyde dehydrogenase-phosphopantetheinyl transferase [Euphorbia peplus]
MEKGVERWIVDISKWNPSSLDFSSALSLLPQFDHSSITRFVRNEDRKRALVSRLLQYAIVHQVLGIPFHQIVINRTSQGKPYLESAKGFPDFPNFNFNVSHHGDFVAIASEPMCIVGVDIVCRVKPQKETIQEFLCSFTSYFSTFEWNNIMNSHTDDEILLEFYRYWCLKEAFGKAIGSGLTHEMNNVEFHHNNWTNIFVKVNGKHMKEWRFSLFDLPNHHWVCVARGPPKAAAESYKKTITRMEFDEDEYQKGLSLPNVKFVSQTVEQLLSQMCMIASTEQKNRSHSHPDIHYYST